MQHYVTGDVAPRAPVYLPDEAYAAALDALVKGCVDVLLVHNSTGTSGADAGVSDATSPAAAAWHVLLGRRHVEPQPGWWFLGGRMVPFEAPVDTAARHTARDTGLALPPGAFTFLRAASYAWARRKQAPVERGTADVALTYYAAVTAAQRDAAANKADDEYAEMAWRPLVAALWEDDSLHPALRDALRELADALARRGGGGAAVADA
jgi:ADP-ribose pyrophosphatase YjhB (NUDIX family)